MKILKLSTLLNWINRRPVRFYASLTSLVGFLGIYKELDAANLYLAIFGLILLVLDLFFCEYESKKITD